ncbi:MAG: YbaB/EbfC family nucleoid-associated protein [Bacilli bacterium]
MNVQAMMKQAQKLQKDMMVAKDEIDNTLFEGESSIVKVKMNGKKQLLQTKIDSNDLSLDDIEILEDMIVIAVNDALKKIDTKTNEKMGKYTQGMPGLF